MSKLPSTQDVEESRLLDHEGLSIWPSVLNAEEASLREAPTKPIAKYNDKLVGARLLGFLLLDLWHQKACSFGSIPYHTVVKQTTSCLSIGGLVVDSDEEKAAQNVNIQMLGLHYRNHLFRVFRSNGGPLPESSNHPSRPSLDVMRDRIIKEMKTPTTVANARKTTLLRDGYRCMLSRAYDHESANLYPELEECERATNAGFTAVQCAHIFSETAQDSEKKVSKLPYAGTAMAILEVFGLAEKKESLVGKNVHLPFNTLSMEGNLHQLFDRLVFWLEEVIGQPHTYDIRTVDSKIFRTRGGIPSERVTFQVDPAVVARCVANGKEPPALPSPALLAIRAACSRVAHMSGAAEQIDQILRDLEETPVMAWDGGSAELLASRLSQKSGSAA
ncbi:hypothetical protein B0H15DRAFT_799075 [Mycena belliarum]|uniref:HNH nuclease domain-containing protein n=1 Tax=Mycena belliarum TaxID=1033014 RepID=A0AAD6UB47_9AGAR|nr:hypothetical protein B0H15DRAFT_799075 [Mycena belliae]